ncbi:GNAT family N-acetyltransferase [Micromonospora sp. NBC_01699]|uniref:GNAT family N-acetyltransferase n=1 Tax=Micromonospora sp. NBC_01699 TaxID=2975984 RepID=UPI002E311439|nr:GNAT family N-acetyltransferase [Micromonospora sp. NBC_01699]
MAITIRTAVETDLPALLALYGQLHPDDTPLPVDRAGPIWREITAQPGRTVLLASRDGVPAGTLDCTVLPNLTRGGRPFMLVENVVVDSSVRRRGVGRRLLAAAVDLARSTGCYKVQLLSRSTRDEAHDFYESCGFRQIAAGFRHYLAG